MQQKPGITSYLWYTSSSGITVNGSGNSGTIEGNTPGTYQFTIRTFNECGFTEQAYFVNVLNYGDTRCSGIMYRYSAYPNPAGNELTVAYIKEGKETDNAKFRKDFTISLFNGEGKVLKSGVNLTENNSVTLDTHLLKNGIYYLHITDSKETIKRQIIIKPLTTCISNKTLKI
ncbi:MAG: T9SS type A sorting domain-containing protein [Daejeonella sp.]